MSQNAKETAARAAEEERRAAWERDKPRPRRRGPHGRTELVVHPHLLRGAGPMPRIGDGPGE